MHSCRNDDWLTPEYIIEKVRRVLGEIDLDPASSKFANERIRARNIFTKEQNGLIQPWWGNVFINPPGGKVDGKSLTALFWKKLVLEIQQEESAVQHAIFLAFSAEALQNTQGKGVPSIGSYTFCIPAKRIRFDFPGPAIKTAPSHSNVIVYVPGKIDHTDKFLNEFCDLGQLCMGIQTTEVGHE